MSPIPQTPRATLIGAIAVLLWATLALLTTLSGSVPPFQLTAMTFTVGFGVGLVFWWRAGQNPLHCLKLPYRVWALGLGGCLATTSSTLSLCAMRQRWPPA